MVFNSNGKCNVGGGALACGVAANAAVCHGSESLHCGGVVSLGNDSICALGISPSGEKSAGFIVDFHQCAYAL